MRQELRDLARGTGDAEYAVAVECGLEVAADPQNEEAEGDAGQPHAVVEEERTQEECGGQGCGQAEQHTSGSISPIENNCSAPLQHEQQLLHEEQAPSPEAMHFDDEDGPAAAEDEEVAAQDQDVPKHGEGATEQAEKSDEQESGENGGGSHRDQTE